MREAEAGPQQGAQTFPPIPPTKEVQKTVEAGKGDKPWQRPRWWFPQVKGKSKGKGRGKGKPKGKNKGRPPWKGFKGKGKGSGKQK